MGREIRREKGRRLWAVGWALILALPLAGSGFAQAVASPPRYVAMAPGTQDTPQPPSQAARYVPGEVLVRFRDGVSQARIDALLDELGLKVKAPLSLPRAFRLEITNRTPVEAMVDKLRTHEEVESADPNWLSHLNPPGPRPGPLKLKQ